MNPDIRNISDNCVRDWKQHLRHQKVDREFSIWGLLGVLILFLTAGVTTGYMVRGIMVWVGWVR